LLVNTKEAENEAILAELDKNGFVWVSVTNKQNEHIKITKTTTWKNGDLVLCLFKKELHVMLVKKESILEDKERVIFVCPKNIFGKATQRKNKND